VNISLIFAHRLERTKRLTAKKMETVFESNEFVIKFNGGKTYMLIAPAGNCVFATDSLRKCKNYYTRIFA